MISVLNSFPFKDLFYRWGIKRRVQHDTSHWQRYGLWSKLSINLTIVLCVYDKSKTLKHYWNCETLVLPVISRTRLFEGIMRLEAYFDVVDYPDINGVLNLMQNAHMSSHGIQICRAWHNPRGMSRKSLALFYAPNE